MLSSERLKEIANLLGGKVKASNVVGSGLTLDLKDYKGYKIKFYSYPNNLNIQIKSENRIAVSFNQPDSVCLINKPLLIEYPIKVFISSSLNSENQIIECKGLADNEAAAILWNQSNIDRLKSCATDVCAPNSTITVQSDFSFEKIAEI